MDSSSEAYFEKKPVLSGVEGINGVYEFSVKNEIGIKKTINEAKTLTLTVEC